MFYWHITWCNLLSKWRFFIFHFIFVPGNTKHSFWNKTLFSFYSLCRYHLLTIEDVQNYAIDVGCDVEIAVERKGICQNISIFPECADVCFQNVYVETRLNEFSMFFPLVSCPKLIKYQTREYSKAKYYL